MLASARCHHSELLWLVNVWRPCSSACFSPNAYSMFKVVLTCFLVSS